MIPVDFTNFITMFADAIPDEVHPAARSTIKMWLWAAHALMEGDNIGAARIFRGINRKIATELGWFAQGVGIKDIEAVTNRAARGDMTGAVALLLREMESRHAKHC
jgi:hypothetical protein